MLGDSIMVCPIVSPKSTSSNMVEDKKIWIPPGIILNFLLYS